MGSPVDIVTFGCRLNTYESAVMRGHAEAADLGPQTLIFNTCAVTAAAESEARAAIRRARREHPQARIIVTGCAAQINPASFSAMAEVDHVIGNDDKLKAATFTGLAGNASIVNDIAAARETAGHLTADLTAGFEGHTRAFLQVQNGCDHRCTFCIIPYGRGPSRSVPIGEIAAEVRKLVEAGYQEIIFTGVDVTSYGADLPGQPSLGQMIRRVLALVPELPRLRLSSLDPACIDDDLWHLVAAEPRLMPHLHLSFQAGDDMILKRMKRRHSRADAIAVCRRARDLRPDVTFGADLIAGFPTETDDMFANTLASIEDCDLTWLHIFPYSARSGTPAAKMPQLPMPVRKERAQQLRASGARQVQKFLATQVGQTVSVLTEKNNTGRTPHFAAVKFAQPVAANQLLQARITGVTGEQLEAVVC